MSEQIDERRLAERKKLWAKATLLLAPGQSCEVRTLDLSTGGVGVIAPINLKPGTNLLIKLLLPIELKGNFRLEAKARVAHSIFSGAESGFKIGLSFSELSPEATAAIALYLK